MLIYCLNFINSLYHFKYTIFCDFIVIFNTSSFKLQENVLKSVFIFDRRLMEYSRACMIIHVAVTVYFFSGSDYKARSMCEQ